MNQDGGNFAVEDITEFIQLGESYIGCLSALNLLIDPIESHQNAALVQTYPGHLIIRCAPGMEASPSHARPSAWRRTAKALTSSRFGTVPPSSIAQAIYASVGMGSTF